MGGAPSTRLDKVQQLTGLTSANVPSAAVEITESADVPEECHPTVTSLALRRTYGWMNSRRHRNQVATKRCLEQKPNGNVFNPDDKRRIRRTWLKLHQMKSRGPSSRELVDAQRGTRVFLRIFQLAPEARQLFTGLGDLNSPVDLLSSSLFGRHAARFMTAVDLVVNNIDTLDIVVTPTLIQLGRRHLDFPGFSLHYINAFQKAMDDIWRSDLGWYAYRGETRRAWLKLFHFITSCITEGYYYAAIEGR